MTELRLLTVTEKNISAVAVSQSSSFSEGSDQKLLDDINKVRSELFFHPFRTSKTNAVSAEPITTSKNPPTPPISLLPSWKRFFFPADNTAAFRLNNIRPQKFKRRFQGFILTLGLCCPFVTILSTFSACFYITRMLL